MTRATTVPQLDKLSSGLYIVFNGWKNNRRQQPFPTYNSWVAEAELKSRNENRKA